MFATKKCTEAWIKEFAPDDPNYQAVKSGKFWRVFKNGDGLLSESEIWEIEDKT